MNDNKEFIFSNIELRRLIFPLIIEQFLTTFVGMADTIMVSTLGEGAVSAVSLVDTINVLLLNIFAALATGGAVVCGQALGCKDKELAKKAGRQLVLFGTLASVLVMLIVYIGKGFILHVLFGKITEEVYGYSNTYLMIVNLSIPFMAIYNCGAALFRTMGNSKITMLVSLLMNVINVAGNAILLFVFKFGVEGVAIPTLISRVIAAIVIIALLNNDKLDIYIRNPFKTKWNGKLIKKILHIGIPNGVENSMFQLGKILLLSLVSAFGTASIAANAVANTIAALEILPGMAIGLALVTVVSRCIGAGSIKQARFYTRKMMKYAIISMAALNVIMIILLPAILGIYSLSDETYHMAKEMLIWHGSLAIFVWPFAFTLPNALRAANDVKFSMIAGMCSMWTVRIGAGYLIASYFNVGVMGIWFAMFIDWFVRAAIFAKRYVGHKWEMKK